MGRKKIKREPVENGTSNIKRKHVFLSILKKVEILEKLDNGTPPRIVSEAFGISTRAIYDIRKNKEKILKFYAKSDSKEGMTNRKTVHTARFAGFDDIVYEWFKQRRSEGVPISGLALRLKAKQLFKDLRIKGKCDFSDRWLTRFKTRHGILDLKGEHEEIWDKAAPESNKDAAEEFIEVFSKMVSKENLSPEQIYNFDETSLFWRCLPLKTLVTGIENVPEDVKESRERLTVLLCSNAAGSHKCTPLLVGNSANPRAVKRLPVIYKNNKKSLMTREIILDWFRNHFVKEARSHCREMGFPDDCKIVLLLENRPAYPDIELLASNNVICLSLPPNTAAFIQPMNQGVINSWKCHYKTNYLRRVLSIDPSFRSFDFYQKSFTLRDAVYMVIESWNSVSKSSLKSAWYDLWPCSIFFDSDDEEDDFEGFELSEVERKATELLLYAKEVNSDFSNAFQKDAIIDWLSSVNEDPPDRQEVTDDEIVSNVLDTLPSDMDTGSDYEVTEVTFRQGLKSGDLYLKFLKQQECVTQQEIETIYALQQKLYKELF